MKLVMLFGDAAVGKMTVGQELAKLTGLKLFHNHMTIEPVLELFGFFCGPAIERIRDVVFEEFAKTDNYGMIFTFMWAFELGSDWTRVRDITEKFEAQGAEVYYVELDAPYEVRRERNATPHRLECKPSKRDIENSAQRLEADYKNHRCTSREGEIPYKNFLRINNADMQPGEAARLIRDTFML